MATFISYSRINSDFSVRLAKDLKSAGYDVWLDQLDIPTGARWDDELERALEASDTFLIVMSPQSIQSQNVKDEIGYAIDTGKNILPIVLENCKVPFRLRRFQYVDVSEETYEDSLIKIKFLLDNARDEKVVTPLNDSAPPPLQTPPTHAQSPGSSSAPKPVADQSSQTRNIGIGIGALLLLIVGFFGARMMGGKSAQTLPTDTPLPAATNTEAIIVPTETMIPVSQTPTEVRSTPSVTAVPEELTDATGVVMRLIPAGEFVQGGSGEPDESPAHNVYLDAFYMDTYEVTNQQYSACLADGACPSPKSNASLRNANYFGNPQFDQYPVINVNWEMAKAYCEWRGAELPTEAQWEKSARGTDGRVYPWGNDISCSNANYGGCVKDIAMVGSNPSGKSVYGVYDLAGNVWEWVSDWYSADYYSGMPAENPVGPGGGEMKVMRGGSWSDLASSARSSNRYGNDPKLFGDSVGFRCARAVTP